MSFMVASKNFQKTSKKPFSYMTCIKPGGDFSQSAAPQMQDVLGDYEGQAPDINNGKGGKSKGRGNKGKGKGSKSKGEPTPGEPGNGGGDDENKETVTTPLQKAKALAKSVLLGLWFILVNH